MTIQNARSVHLPPALRASLLELFGPGVDDVRIIEHSWYARLHGRIVATTRRRHIYLRGSAAGSAQSSPQVTRTASRPDAGTDRRA